MRVFAAITLLAVLCSGHVYAMGTPGGGQGTTKIDFKFDTTVATRSRLFAKIDVSTVESQLGDSGTPSHNDDLAGYTLTLTIGGSATFSAVCDSKGKTKENASAVPAVPFTSKITGNGKGMQIMADGLNLQSLLGIDPTKGDGSVTVEIDVSASKTDAATLTTTTVALSTQMVTFNYKVKGNSVKGSNH